MKVELLADHTHAGRRYPSGQVLDLPDEQARWLIGLGVAEPDADPVADQAAAAQPPPRAGGPRSRSSSRKD